MHEAEREDRERLAALSGIAKELAGHLDAIWITQALLAALGTLYILETPLAEGLAENFRLKPELIQWSYPFVAAFLFIRMGVWLAGYLETRKALN